MVENVEQQQQIVRQQQQIDLLNEEVENLTQRVETLSVCVKAAMRPPMVEGTAQSYAAEIGVVLGGEP